VDKLILPSYAKLNLYLKVLTRRRSDGYHSLRSLFERIDLADKITLRTRQDRRINLTSDNKDIPRDSSNLAYRAARLMQQRFAPLRGVDIALSKRIPVGSGLGGGSSNAATVILGLNKLWKLRLSKRDLCCQAEEIGSDVSFFIAERRFAYVSGRGEKVRSLSRLDKLRLWQVLALPRLKVSTRLIYKKWDNLRKAALTEPEYDVKILTSALSHKDLKSLGKSLFNSLEVVTLRLYPEVSEIKRGFLESGAQAVLMSGSGPAVFAITTSGKEARILAGRLRKRSRGWQVFVVCTA
jgi:4-diphosphocytidyl-2-C-methyl-D-erythritol kinase